MSDQTYRQSRQSLLKAMARGKHGLLLLVLLAGHLLIPLTKVKGDDEYLSLLLMTAIQIVGARSVLREDKRLAKVFFATLGVSIALLLSSLAVGGAVLLGLALIGYAIFYAELIRVILIDVLRPGRVDVDRIMGALAAYMLLAVFWSLLYVLVQAWAPNSFDLGSSARQQDPAIDSVTAEPAWKWGAEVDRIMDPFDDLSYFSFVTLTTLGYGDITPRGDMARHLATLEAMIGPIYLAVLLARLVSLQAGQTQGADFVRDE